MVVYAGQVHISSQAMVAEPRRPGTLDHQILYRADTVQSVCHTVGKYSYPMQEMYHRCHNSFQGSSRSCRFVLLTSAYDSLGKELV
jgi:hypothetical protein